MPEKMGSIRCLNDVFGGYTNSKNYIELDPHIGLIQGDGINMEVGDQILSGFKRLGFASTNIVLGMGSYLYQLNTRDTFGLAQKATYAVVNGEARNIYKNPKTDTKFSKKSARGLLRVNEDYTLSECVTEEEEKGGLLETVFLDSDIVKDYSLSEIRSLLHGRK